jgi:homoserine kinase type II
MVEEVDEIINVTRQYELGKIINVQSLTSGFANRNYKLKTEKGNFFYRICTQQEDVKNIVYEVEILSQLKNVNFPTAYLIPRKDGSFISDSENDKVLIYEFIEGSEPDINGQTAKEIARCIAQLNSLDFYKLYPRKNIIHIDYCFELIKEFRKADFQYPEIYSFFEEQTQFLVRPVSGTLPRGLIHGDVFPDNTLFKENRLAALIDFEEVCVDNLLMEIGMCINGFCFIDNHLNIELMEIFLLEYNKVRKITPKELDLLYYFIQWAAHGMISWHLRYYLIHRENSQQLARVNELMERVKRLRADKLPELKRLK